MAEHIHIQTGDIPIESEAISFRSYHVEMAAIALGSDMRILLPPSLDI